MLVSGASMVITILVSFSADLQASIALAMSSLFWLGFVG